MKAVILAAGIGSRLRPLTDSVPKCLVEVDGVPILQRQIEAFKKANIDEILVLTGYLSEKVDQFIEANQYDCVRVINNPDYLSTNNMYSLYLAMDALQDGFVLANGDVIFDPQIIRELIESEYENIIVTEKDSYNEESMKVIVDGNSRINFISKAIKPEEAYGNSIDVYRFSKEAREKLFECIEDHIKANDLKSWTEVAIAEILPHIIFKPLNIGAKYWFEIDNFQDLEMANNIVKGTGNHEEK